LILLEADLLAGQGAREDRGLTASLGALEDDGRAKGALVLVEQGDHERIVALTDADKLAFWRVGAEVNVYGHRASVVTLAKSSAGALYAL
jgi:hypothetical protein